MQKKVYLEIKSYREDGKLLENESGEEFTEEMAAKIVQEYWRDMPIDYCSWDLETVVFKYYDDIDPKTFRRDNND